MLTFNPDNHTMPMPANQDGSILAELAGVLFVIVLIVLILHFAVKSKTVYVSSEACANIAESGVKFIGSIICK